MMLAHVELSPDFLQRQGYCLDTVYAKSRTDPRSFGPTYFIRTGPVVGHFLGQVNTNRNDCAGMFARYQSECALCYDHQASIAQWTDRFAREAVAVAKHCLLMARCEANHVTMERILLIQFFPLILSQPPQAR